MDNGNLAWLDYSVPARRFRNNIPCMKGVWQYKCRMASANILLVIYNKPFALSFHSSSG